MLRQLYSIFANSTDVTSGMISVLILLFSFAVLIFVLLPLHEFAHAFVATKLGDQTAKWNGRLTLNPLAHLDMMGTIMMLIVGIGYAKPVPVNPYNFRKPKQGMALTALAGPISNLLMATVSVGLFRLIVLLFGQSLLTPIGSLGIDAWDILCLIFIDVFAGINIALAVFNLLPIPPLDGSRIFSAILPDKWVYTMERNQRYISIIMIILLFTGALDLPLALLRHGFGFLICGLFGLPNLF